jgi:hypothetical protein
MTKLMGAIVIALGLVSSYLFFSAGNQLKITGEELTILRSQGGQSVAEAYYQQVGRYGIAYSNIAYALAVGVLSISCGLGGILLIRQDK